MSTDPLSGILGLLDIRSAAFVRLEAGGDWSLAFRPRPLVKFNAVLRGRCQLTLDGGTPVQLQAGDAFLLALPPAYTVASDPSLTPADGSALFAAADSGTVTFGGDDVVLIGGSFTIDRPDGDLLHGILPPFLKVDMADPRAAGVRATLARLEAELLAGDLGADLVARRLAEVLLIDMLRAHAGRAGQGNGWLLAALTDPKIGAALAAMHADPGRSWTVAELARIAAMSRSGFARRFTEATGTTPIDHLLHWRMRLARAALRQGGTTVGALAERLGYASESAFGNAFKRVHGRSPRGWAQTAGTQPPADR